MNIRFLMLGVAVLALTGGVAVQAADKKAPAAAWNGLRDGAPPAMASEEAGDRGPNEELSDEEMAAIASEERDPAEEERRRNRTSDQIIEGASDETMEAVLEHNRAIYGTDDGPFTKLEEQKKIAEAAKKKVSMYGMTPEQRAEFLEAEKKAAGGTQERPPMVYKPRKTPDQPPRLFNNVTTPE